MPMGAGGKLRPSRPGGAARQLQEPATPGRRPCPRPARCRTRGGPPAPACRGRTPGCAQVGAARGCSTRPCRQDHEADALGTQCLLQAAGSKRTRNAMQGSVLLQSYGRSSRFGHEADHLIAQPSGPEREDDQRLRCSEPMWSPCRNRTGDPILTIDARVCNAKQHNTSPHKRAAGRPCQGGWDVRHGKARRSVVYKFWRG